MTLVTKILCEALRSKDNNVSSILFRRGFATGDTRAKWTPAQLQVASIINDDADSAQYKDSVLTGIPSLPGMSQDVRDSSLKLLLAYIWHTYKKNSIRKLQIKHFII